MSEHQLDVFLSGFSHLFGLQLVTHIVTFLLNLVVVRRISPSVYGLTAFRLPLLSFVILLLSREAFRRGCLRRDPSKTHSREEELRGVLPLALLPIPIGLLFVSAVLGYLWTRGDTYDIPWPLIIEQAVALVLELLSEPMYIIASLWLEFKRRARVEGTAIFTKSLVTYILLAHTSRDPALAFADAQVIFGLVMIIGYSTLIPSILQTLRKGKGSRGHNSKTWMKMDKTKLPLIRVFFLQTCEKLVLAEGSKFVLMSLRSLYDEGVYALVNNLGSLIPRILFAPFEEAAFAAFSRTDRGGNELRKTANLLRSLVRFIFLIGFLAMVFGPPSSALLLRLLYSTKWSDTQAPVVLACYCPYIAVMALNGTTEAFVHAVLDESGMQTSNLFMLFSAALHLILSTVLVKTTGATGLVLADAINMTARITFSLWCIKKYFRSIGGFSVFQIFPTAASLLTGSAVVVILFACKMLLQELAFPMQLGIYTTVSTACLFVMLWVMWSNERNALDVLQSLKTSNSRSKTD